jgi:hypothetical protein
MLVDALYLWQLSRRLPYEACFCPNGSKTTGAEANGGVDLGGL